MGIIDILLKSVDRLVEFNNVIEVIVMVKEAASFCVSTILADNFGIGSGLSFVLNCMIILFLDLEQLGDYANSKP